MFRIMKGYTNRQMGQCLKEVVIRKQMEKAVDAYFHDTEDKDTKLTDLFCDTHVCLYYCLISYILDFLIFVGMG